jgi:hypothetical protein
MNTWNRIALRGFLVAVTLANAGATAFGAAAPHEMRHLTVTINDNIGVETTTLTAAKAIVSEVYRRAGVQIEWAEPEIVEEPDRLYVNLISVNMASQFSTSKEIVGFATPGSLAANAIYDRIQQVARNLRMRSGVLLGYVMAHELGHLLLPAHSHSATGVMRPNMDVELAANRKLAFTKDQAALILQRLTVAPVVSTHSIYQTRR